MILNIGYPPKGHQLKIKLSRIGLNINVQQPSLNLDLKKKSPYQH